MQVAAVLDWLELLHRGEPEPDHPAIGHFAGLSRQDQVVCDKLVPLGEIRRPVHRHADFPQFPLTAPHAATSLLKEKLPRNPRHWKLSKNKYTFLTDAAGRGTPLAIFSLHHSFTGRSTHAAGAASLFARYVTRPEACTETIGERMPLDREGMMYFLDEQEQGDRKNARVIDKVMVALPIELSHEQNVALLRDF